MSEKKPVPVIAGPVPQTCPVCGKRAYSLGGIHPQCAVHRADAPRRLQLAADKRAKIAKPTQRTWEKTCPKCKAQVPARKGVCDCGFDFVRKQ